MKLASDEDLALGLDDVKVDLDNANTNELEQVEAPKNEKRKTRGLTLMHDVTRIKSMGEKIAVDYNENGVPLARMGINYNLSWDLVCIIISQLHMHLGSWCQLS